MELANYIDHTLLRPDALLRDVEQLCMEAIEYRFKAVCVSPYMLPTVVDLLKHATVKIAVVTGFPFGYAPIPSKVDEIRRVLEEEPDEIDAVINIAAAKNGNWKLVQNDMESMTVATQMRGKVIKMILETALMTDDEIKRLCAICNAVGVNFAKTSTGYNGGATEAAVRLMRSELDKAIKIKASGGIGDYATATKMIVAGADRLGCSRSIAVLKK